MQPPNQTPTPTPTPTPKTRPPPTLTPAQQALAAEIVVAQDALQRLRRHRARKQSLLKLISASRLDEFVSVKRASLRAVAKPVRIGDPVFWDLADYDQYLLWDNFRSDEFWNLLVAVAVQEARGES